MGKTNRKREHQQKMAERRRLETRRREGPVLSVPEVLHAAVSAHVIQAAADFDSLIDRLAAASTSVVDRGPNLLDEKVRVRADAVSTVVEEYLGRHLRMLWRNGWQPADIVGVVGRLDSAGTGHAAAAAVVADARHDRNVPMHPLWASQLDDLQPWWANQDGLQPSWLAAVATTMSWSIRVTIEHAVILLARLGSLPKLPTLIAPPGPGAAAAAAARKRSGSLSAIDPKVLGRVRAMLAKAESTEFPEEADAFTAKAQEMMTRHAIDVAMISSTQTIGIANGPEGCRIHLEAPYVDAKASLVNAVARANRCRAVQESTMGFVTVFGFATDLALVDVLFTSLLAQATVALVVAGRSVSRNGVSKTRSFRQSFLVSFAHRIGERLEAAARTTTKAAESTFGASLLPVLAKRDADVDAAVTEAFPRLRQVRTRVSNEAGWQAGRLAADQASLRAGGELRPSTS